MVIQVEVEKTSAKKRWGACKTWHKRIFSHRKFNHFIQRLKEWNGISRSVNHLFTPLVISITRFHCTVPSNIFKVLYSGSSNDLHYTLTKQCSKHPSPCNNDCVIPRHLAWLDYFNKQQIKKDHIKALHILLRKKRLNKLT